MGRHSSHDILDRVDSGTLPVDDENTQVISRGGDGADMPTAFLPAVEVHEPVKPVDIEKDHLSSEWGIGLGHVAVAAAIDRSYWQTQDRDVSREEQIQKQEIANVRRRLAEMPRKQAKLLEASWMQQDLPEWLKGRLGLDEHDDGRQSGIIEALTARQANEKSRFLARLKGKKAVGETEQEYQLPDETVLNFLEWHNQLLTEKQKSFDERLGKYKEGFTNAIHNAVAAGWIDELPPNLGNVSTVAILVDDGLLTKFHESESGGYTSAGRDFVVISPVHIEKPRKILAHELTHVIEGADIITGEFEVERRRGMMRLFGSGRGGSVMNEAVVEHFSNSLLVGGIDSTRPDHDKRKDATYEENRGLLHYLAEYGVKAVDIRYFTAALFENRHNPQPGDEDAQTDLYYRLREAFPFTDVVREIQAFDEKTDVDMYIFDLDRRTQEFKATQEAA